MMNRIDEIFDKNFVVDEENLLIDIVNKKNDYLYVNQDNHIV